MSEQAITNPEDFVDVATEFLDSEIDKIGEILRSLQQKYGRRSNSAENLTAFRDEALTRLAEIGVLANVDASPCFFGRPPVLDIVGRTGDPGFTKEFDHEQKAYEVTKASRRGEKYLGEKEPVNTRKPTDVKPEL